MRIAIVGADFEENLGVGFVAAALEADHNRVDVVPFQDAANTDDVVSRILARRPDVVGLSIQFQHRAHEFLRLGRRLRERGFQGHVTCGGQFPTLAWRELLANQPAVDSVVLHEGEQTVVELVRAVERRLPLSGVRGLAMRDARGRPVRSEGRPLCPDLDRLPFPKRYRPHAVHVGVPFIPISGSRGCWGRCSYCSITSFYRDARQNGGGRLLRLRSPESIATEMALLWHGAGRPCVFCFHDDNFLLPRPEDTLRRLRAVRSNLDAFGVGKVGLIGKCRPETLTPELARELRRLGVVRLYVGVENASQAGSDHLNRRTRTESVRRALCAAREAGIFACYNLLVFEPDATLDEVRENIAFMRDHASHPVNFCRAEPYHGTPLHARIAGTRGVGGSYLGWDYRIDDDATELLFRICAAAFRERNFAPRGVANRTMGLGYSLALLEHFYEERRGEVARIRRRVEVVTRGIVLETADLLQEALELARLDDAERVQRETALLGLRIAAFDSAWHVTLDELQVRMDALVADVGRIDQPTTPTRRLMEAVQGLAAASLLAVGVSACGGQATSDDPVPPDAGVDADGGEDASTDVHVVDPLPEDSGVEADVMVSDPLPEDSGVEADVMVSDPLPEDSGVDADAMVADPPPPDAGFSHEGKEQAGAAAEAFDHWRDSTPRRAVRSMDLPLHDPPSVHLDHHDTDEGVLVRAVGGPDAMTLRWEGDGDIEGEGRQVLWRPATDDDQLRLAVRTRGGVAIVTLRAADR